MTLTYAIGDIHGCLTQLEALIGLCEADAGERLMKFIFLGDYIDRGLDAQGTVDRLIRLQTEMPNHVVCLKGNHEDMLLAAIEDEGREEHWLRNGGTQTLYSYEVPNVIDLPRRHLDWFRSLPTFYDDGLRFFVHAGVHPDRPLNKQNERDMLWIREPFLSSTKDFGRIVVHGHSPTEDGKPDIRRNRVGLDTGAVYRGTLTAAKFTQESLFPVEFVCVPPSK